MAQIIYESSFLYFSFIYDSFLTLFKHFYSDKPVK